MKNDNLDPIVRIYMKQASKYKVLSREQEVALIKEYQSGSKEARDILVNSSARFVFSIAIKYKKIGVPFADLIQEGNLGLVTALSRFNPESNCRLLTFAVWHIKSHIQDYVAKNFSIVKNGTEDLRVQLFARNKTQKRTSISDYSLNVPITEDTSSSWQDTLESEELNPEEQLATIQNAKQLKDIVEAALKELNDQEQTVLRARLLEENSLMLREIGARMNVTRQRVQQIEAKGTKKLKTILERTLNV